MACRAIPMNAYECFLMCYIDVVFVVKEVVSFQGAWSINV